MIRNGTSGDSLAWVPDVRWLIVIGLIVPFLVLALIGLLTPFRTEEDRRAWFFAILGGAMLSILLLIGFAIR